MQTCNNLVEPPLQTTSYSYRTEFKPFVQQGQQILDLGTAIDADHVHIDAITAFKVSRRKQVIHQLFLVDTIRARHNYDTCRVLMIRFITNV